MKKIFFLFLIILIYNQTALALTADISQVSSSADSLTKEDRIFGLVTIYQAAKGHRNKMTLSQLQEQMDQDRFYCRKFRSCLRTF